jgi:DnaJ-domain-containing protein 1
VASRCRGRQFVTHVMQMQTTEGWRASPRGRSPSYSGGMRTRDWATVDFYGVLGVEATASGDEIALAFRALAKQLHPDRAGASEAAVERFKSVTAAYDVLGDERLRHSYDAVRIDVLAARTEQHAASPSVTATESPRPPLPRGALRTRAHRWLAGGVAVTLIGIVVAALVVHLQVQTHDRRAGRIKTAATVVAEPTRTDVQFTTTDGQVVRVPEPDRVNPGTQRDGQRVTILYRPDRPTDVIIDESTTARDITLWFVAIKLLVGGPVFLGVGIRRLRQARAA